MFLSNKNPIFNYNRLKLMHTLIIKRIIRRLIVDYKILIKISKSKSNVFESNDFTS